MTDPGHRTIDPGEYRLYFASNALHHIAKMSGRNVPGGISVSTILAELAQNPVTVSVDWVIDSSGRLIGPDPHHIFEKLQAEQQARQALASRLALSADPLSTLQVTSNVHPGRHHGLWDRDFYNEQLRRDANRLLRLSNAGSAAAAANYIKRVNREILITKR